MSMTGTTSDGGAAGRTSLFAITAKPPALRLAAGTSGTVAFTVSLTGAPPAGGANPFPAHANVVPQAQMGANWLTLEGDSHRAFAPNSTEVFTIKVGVPADATPGDYALRLDMIG